MTSSSAGAGAPGDESVPPPDAHPSGDPGTEPVDAAAQRAAEEHNLAGSVTALSRLSSSALDLEELLTEVATYAVRAVPGADGAGLTLIERDRADVIVKTAPFVREVDDIQYGIGEGPCISAAATGRPMRSGSIGADQRWPQFGPGWAGWACTASCPSHCEPPTAWSGR